MLLADIFADAGLPAGVLNVIHVAPKDAPEVVEAIIAHPSVGKINFTGSTRVGSIIAASCGKHLKVGAIPLLSRAPIAAARHAFTVSSQLDCAHHSLYSPWFSVCHVSLSNLLSLNMVSRTGREGAVDHLRGCRLKAVRFLLLSLTLVS